MNLCIDIDISSNILPYANIDINTNGTTEINTNVDIHIGSDNIHVDTDHKPDIAIDTNTKTNTKIDIDNEPDARINTDIDIDNDTNIGV